MTHSAFDIVGLVCILAAFAAIGIGSSIVLVAIWREGCGFWVRMGVVLGFVLLIAVITGSVDAIISDFVTHGLVRYQPEHP